MNTGNSYLLSVDLDRDLSLRFGGTDAGIRAAGLTGHSIDSTGAVRPLPLRPLDPDVLDAVDDDVDDYANRCLTTPSIESLFDLVIATAELRAGREIVSEVLVALAAAPEGATPSALAAGDDDRAISIAHVVAILGNHLHRIGDTIRLTPVLRAAVERRYPLGIAATRSGARAALALTGSAIRRTPLHRAVAGERDLATAWRSVPS